MRAIFFPLLLCSLCNANAAENDVFHRELFVDHHAIERMDNVRLELQHPVRRETVLKFDKPWEGAFCGYVTVIKDGDLYRMYYRGLPTAGKDGSEAEVTCYAESKDGINWTKPELGLYEWEGSKANNIVLAGQAPFSHNFAPFLDASADYGDDKRYKAFAGTSESGLFRFVSKDGIHWSKLGEQPAVRKGAFDSQNVGFWSEPEQRYVCYFRTWSEGGYEGIRTVSRSEALGFDAEWSEPVPMTFGDTPLEHLYTNQTQPYFRKPDLYVGTAARFLPGRQVVSDEEAKRLGVIGDYFKDCSDVVLLTSRGGLFIQVAFDRYFGRPGAQQSVIYDQHEYQRTFMEGFIIPGPGLENWTSRTNYPACGIVPTGETEMSMYVQKKYGQPEHGLERYSLRTDGFVAVAAPYEGGELVTKLVYVTVPNEDDMDLCFVTPCLYELLLNFASSAAGSVCIEIQDEKGQPIPGFELEQSKELIGDRIDYKVTWSEKEFLPKVPFRIRLAMKDARLFSFAVNCGGDFEIKF